MYLLIRIGESEVILFSVGYEEINTTPYRYLLKAASLILHSARYSALLNTESTDA
ncbi:MAG: hypothetical protein ACJA0Z_002467 [Halioglobus sp.]|jgi:hypothetical protein